MKLIAKSIAWLLLLLPLLLGVLFALSIDNEPMLRQRADLTPERIAEGKRVFDRYDPRRLRSGTLTSVSLSERDLDLAINYAANQVLDGVAGLRIGQGKALIQVTLNLPVSPLGRFLNLQLELRQGKTLPEIEQLVVGKLSIPGFLAKPLLYGAAEIASPIEDWQSLISMIRYVKFRPKQTMIIYQWQEELPGKLTSALWSVAERERLKNYQGKLAALVQDGTRHLQLTNLLQPLFQLAGQRSLVGDAVAENRALILVLAFYVNQKDLSNLMPQAKKWPRPQWRYVLLNGRRDLTKHYLVSAMLAAYAGTPLADAVGLYKEIEDSKGGSGFSFIDLAADRAGRRMGELAVSGEIQAKAIQRRLAMAVERDFMPPTADLVEFMQEAEFRRRFGGLQGEGYRQILADIDQRIAMLPINF